MSHILLNRRYFWGVMLKSSYAGAFRLRVIGAILCVVTFLAESASALDPARSLRHYRLDTWTTEQGLPHNSISAIIQTRDGFLWIATLRGVVRFDGVQFQHVSIPAATSDRCRNFTSLVQTPDGSVWIATEGAGFLRVNRDEIQVFDVQHGFPDNHVQTLSVDSCGGLWIGTWSSGVFYLKPPYVIDSVAHFSARNGLPSDRIRDVTAGADSDAWVTTLNGQLSHITPRGTPEISVQSLAPNKSVLYLLRRRDGSLWASSTDGVFAVHDGKLVQQLPSAVPGADFSVTMLEDRNGTFWGGSYLSGVTRKTQPSDGNVVSTLTTRNGIAGNYISALCEDSEGNIWIGTEVGLNRLSDGSFYTLGEDDGFTGEYVTAFAQTGDGVVWAGTDGDGLLRIEDGRVVRRFRERNGIKDPFVATLAVNHLGTLILGTNSGVIYSMKNGRTPVTLYDAHHTIYAIVERWDGSIWCATSVGIERFSGRSTRQLMSPAVGAKENGTCLLSASSGTLWAGTRSGLIGFHDGFIKIYHTADGLPGDYITCLTEDHAGILWVGTSDGIARFIDGKFQSFSASQGLTERYVTSINEDNRGHLWLGTLSGIYRVARADFDSVAQGVWFRIRPLAFGEIDGMKSSECAEGSRVSLREKETGRIWFSTTSGVAVVDPTVLLFHPALGPLQVQRLVLQGGKEFIHSPFDLSAGENNFTIQYTLPAFTIQNHLRFQYRLEDFDNDWVDAGNRRSAYYTNVPPGEYRFLVRASSELPGAAGVTSTAKELTIAPWFYQRKIFYVGIGIFLLAGLGLSHIARVRSSERREALLTRTVKKRTQELLTEIAERKRAESALRSAEEHKEAILQMMPLVLYTSRTPDEMSATWITDNTAAVTGFPPDRFLVEKGFWRSRIHPEDMKRVEAFLGALRTGKAGDIEYRWQCADGSYHWFLDHTVSVHRDADGHTEYSGVWFDITDKMEAEEQLRISLREKEALLREVHHRVKNNLTIITSLLNLQAASVEGKQVRDVLREAEGRVRSMATLHEHLYKSDLLGAVDLRSYISSLVRTLTRTYNRLGIDIVTEIEGVTLDIALAIPCGLIVNELVTNAMKYAFPPDTHGLIVVSLTKEPDHQYVLKVRDNGIGFSPPYNLEESPTLGLKLVSILSRQLGGTAVFTYESGTCCTVRFSDEHANASAPEAQAVRLA